MNSSKPIGGYFELELRDGDFPHSDSILLNSARNCFEYVLRAKRPERVYMPAYTCAVMFEPLVATHTPYSLYTVNSQLELEGNLEVGKNELLMYTDYFGIKDKYSRSLSRQYGDKLILDASQAFFTEPLKSGDTLYSPRKFFGVPDGGCLVSKARLSLEIPAAKSYLRSSHLLRRIDEGAEAGYADFQRDDEELSGLPIQVMSDLTRRLLMNIDFAEVKARRIRNFNQLSSALSGVNPLRLDIADNACPMVYPLFTRNTSMKKTLIEHKIFVPTYWPELAPGADKNTALLADEIVPLPIDQRYSSGDMKRILEVINEC
jgi:hypothetical protein